jgi:hypothetical protein
LLVTSVIAIANMVVEAIGLSNVKFSYTGGNRGWRGDIPQVRFDITKIRNLGWKQCHCEPFASCHSDPEQSEGEESHLRSGQAPAWQPDIVQLSQWGMP